MALSTLVKLDHGTTDPSGLVPTLVVCGTAPGEPINHVILLEQRTRLDAMVSAGRGMKKLTPCALVKTVMKHYASSASDEAVSIE